MNVLSLFDGLSGGRIALDRLGMKVDNYFASEIDKYAIAVAKYNFPKTQHIGSVVDVDISKLPKIDLLIGGSPCQGFSFAGKRKGASTSCNIDVTTLEQYLELKSQNFEFDGQSYLFWEYMRILEEIRVYNPDVKFMLENVVMSKKWQSTFNTAMKCQPLQLNSNLVSAQNRRRLYWTNIQVDGQPTDKQIFLKDIVENNITDYDLSFKHHQGFIRNYKWRHRELTEKANTLLASYYKQPPHSPYIICDTSSSGYRRLTPLECERLQTLPENYTNVIDGKKKISDTQRYKMIGNGWTIDVICHLLKNVHKPINKTI